MIYLKKYNTFESVNSPNNILDVIDCYIDLFDDLSFKQFKLNELPGYGGILESEKDSKRPYVLIDTFKRITAPHDSIVLCNSSKGLIRFESEVDKNEWLEKSNLSYFVIYEDSDSDNPGCVVKIYDSSINKNISDKLDANQFYFIKNGKLRDLIKESNRRCYEQLNINTSPLIYSFDGECNIIYHYNKFRFRKSELGRYLRDGIIDRKRYDRLIKDAI